MKQRLAKLTVAEELEAQLREARAFQVFMRRLGPNDVVYVSILGWDHAGNVVEAKSSAMDLAQALSQAIRNIEQATAPEEEL